jgi:hypothetical protein
MVKNQKIKNSLCIYFFDILKTTHNIKILINKFYSQGSNL